MELNIEHVRQLLTALRRRAALVLTCIAIALAIGAIYCGGTVRVFESEARLLVQYNTDGLSEAELRAFTRSNELETQLRILKSPVILDRASKSLQGKHVDVDSLIVDSPRRTQLIDIRYRSPDASHATDVVQAVTDAYVAFIDETHRSSSRETLRILIQQQEQCKAELLEKQTAHAKLRQDAGLILSQGAQTTIHEQQIAVLNEQLIKARTERMSAESEYRQVAEALSESEPVSLFTVQIAGSVGQQFLSEKLGVRSDYLRYLDVQAGSALRQDEIDLAQIADIYGPEHPQYRSLRTKIESNRNYLTNPGQAQSSSLEARAQEIGRLVRSSAEQKVQAAVEFENRIAQELDAARRKAEEESTRYVELEALDNEIKRATTWYDALVKRISELDLGEDLAQIRVRVVGPPTSPERPVWPSIPKVMLLSMLFGPLAGAALALVMDRLDNNFQSPEDIKRSLDVAVFGNIPLLSAQAGRKHDFAIVDRPQSPEAEAFRAIRTSLLFHRDLQLISVTSPFQGDGKSTVICNTASALAQAGKRTLLIDCDLRRPRMKSVWELPLSRGLSHLLANGLADEAVIQDEIHSTRIENLFVLPSGPVPPNPSELLEAPHLLDVLSWAKQKFDYVLLDSPPVLPVADAGILARLVDGIVLVVRVQKDGRTATLRAKETLTSVGGQLAGVVVNGIDQRTSYGYYYKQGNYSAGYHLDGKQPGVSPRGQTLELSRSS